MERIEEDYPALLRQAIVDESFVEATFREAQRGATVPWPRVTIRPVLLRGARHWQFTYFDGRQDTAKNYELADIEEQLGELLALPFKSLTATTTAETVRVQYSKKGRPILHREPRRGAPIPLDLAHDRAKAGILSEEQPAEFLKALGVATADGRVRADQRRKFNQINEFLRLMDDSGSIEDLRADPIHVVDLGCGSAALTFAVYHYLNIIKGRPATVIGVDAKAHLMERHNKTAGQLGWTEMYFEAAQIEEFQAATAPDVVLALHACDTATDEALARAVGWGSHLILSAPCCHHHLQAQLAAAETPDPFRPVARHGILRERLGDILTDAMRAHILRLLGYRSEVLEFVAVEHTPKNLMIRAVYTGAPAPAALVAEYQALKAYWGVTPYLEQLLAERIQPILAANAH